MAHPALALALLVGVASPSRAQPMSQGTEPSGKSALAESLNKVLTDPAEIEKAEKEKNRPPIEIFKSIILPNDVLPYIKANQWSTLAIELRSNQIGYAGTLETYPVRLLGMPQEVVYRRDAGLVKGQRSRLLLQILSPAIPKELLVRLLRPESLRDDETYPAALRVLEPHQMLIPILTKGPNDAYGRWGQLKAMVPLSAARTDEQVRDRQRYYRLVLPAEAEHPQLPTHPLTWTAISHVIWDGMPPEALNISQQEAMLDWLHWGGQLVLVGGAGPNFAPLRESFLGPYLPAEPSGQSAQLSADDLRAFAEAYPPVAPTVEPDDPIEGTQTYASAFEEVGRRYKAPSPLLIPRGKPLYVANLTPKPGSRVVGFGKAGLPPMGVERRVGRGRILMLSFGLTDPALMAWPGYDTMVRRVVLRRPEEPLGDELRYNPIGVGGYLPPRYDFLNGPDLTAVRLLSRDLGAPTRRVGPQEDPDGSGSTIVSSPGMYSMTKSAGPTNAINPASPFQVPVAEWLDGADLPRMSRDALVQASGIEIPGHRFVLTVILAYMLALVPINWLVCRFAFGRREWAWLVVPLLAVGFAVAVERAAAYDVGYDSACSEVDVIESFGDYPRGHLSRFASLYTTGRVRYSIAYPNDPSALALPLNTGRSIRGEEVQQSVFQATPTPSLTNFQVQPRSLAMFRAEQYTNLPGAVTLAEEGGVRRVVNGTGVELRDAVAVLMGEKSTRAIPLGTIAARATVELKGEGTGLADFVAGESPDLKKNEIDPLPFLQHLVRSSSPSGPEEVGEVRLIAWAPGPQGGQEIDPPVDLHRGFTLVVAHLKTGPTPDPASPRYNILAAGPERPSTRLLNTPPPQVNRGGNMGMMMRGGTAPQPAAPRAIPVPRSAMPGAPAPRPAAPPKAGDSPMPGPTKPDDAPDPPGGPEGKADEPGQGNAPESPRR